MQRRTVFLFCSLLAAAGCSAAGSKSATHAMAPAPPPVSDPTPGVVEAPLPKVTITEGGITPPNDIVSSWRPMLGISPPSHWTVVANENLLPGEYGKVVDPRTGASITYTTHASEESAIDEAIRIEVDSIRRGLYITDGIVISADKNRMEFGWKQPDSKTCGYVIVRHYGADGHVSFTFVGSWPCQYDNAMHRVLETFVNDMQLLSQ